MVIEVTREDISASQRRHCWKCPIARAVGRKTGQTAIVAYDAVLLGDRRRDLSAAAIARMWAFDEDGPVEPFTFELEIEP